MLDVEKFYHDGRGNFAHRCPSCSATIRSQITPTVLEAVTCPTCGRQWELAHPEEGYVVQGGGDRWLSVEDDVLYQVYPDCTHQELTARFARTPSALSGRMRIIRQAHPAWEPHYKRAEVINASGRAPQYRSSTGGGGSRPAAKQQVLPPP